MKCENQNASGGGRTQAIVVLAAALVIGAVVYALMTSSEPETRAPEAPIASHAAQAQQTAQTLFADDPVPFRVYYFHRTIRCIWCDIIEEVTQSAVEEVLAAEVGPKKLMWKNVNMDEQENQRFEKHYGLELQSVVLSEVRDGKEIRFKQLEKVWVLLDDEAALRDYIIDAVHVFMTAS